MRHNLSSYEREIGFSLNEHESKWSKEDIKLRDWLTACSVSEVSSFLAIFRATSS